MNNFNFLFLDISFGCHQNLRNFFIPRFNNTRRESMNERMKKSLVFFIPCNLSFILLFVCTSFAPNIAFVIF